MNYARILNFRLMIFALTFLLAISFYTVNGQIRENAPSAITKRDLALFIKIFPNTPIPSNHTRYLQFRIYDTISNQTVNHVTILLTVLKENQVLMQDYFHSHSGFLTLKIMPISNIGNWTIHGNKEDTLNSWIPYADDEPLGVSAPIFTDDLVYEFRIQIVGADNDKDMFMVDNAPRFDYHLSIYDKDNQEIKIPLWFENDAKWYSLSQITDVEFEGAIEHLIQQGIMKVPQSSFFGYDYSQDTSIRDNAGMWADGNISDDQFAKDIKYMIAHGIVKIQ